MQQARLPLRSDIHSKTGSSGLASSAVPNVSMHQCLHLAIKYLHFAKVLTATWLATVFMELIVLSILRVNACCFNCWSCPLSYLHLLFGLASRSCCNIVSAAAHQVACACSMSLRSSASLKSCSNFGQVLSHISCRLVFFACCLSHLGEAGVLILT